MKSLLEFLLLRMVQHPEDLVIDETEEDGYQVYRLHLHQEDIGRVIGKNGKVIKALRRLAQVRAIIDRQHVRVLLAEE